MQAILQQATVTKTEVDWQGGAEVARSVMVFFGVVLCLAAFGLWLVPEAVSSPESTVLRAGLTPLFIGTGYFLFSKGRVAPVQLEAHLDLQHGELRHLERDQHGVARVVDRFGLAELTLKPVKGGLVACLADGREVLQLPEGGAAEALRLAHAQL